MDIITFCPIYANVRNAQQLQSLKNNDIFIIKKGAFLHLHPLFSLFTFVDSCAISNLSTENPHM